jgi:hypothetical protein
MPVFFGLGIGAHLKSVGSGASTGVEVENLDPERRPLGAPNGKGDIMAKGLRRQVAQGLRPPIEHYAFVRLGGLLGFNEVESSCRIESEACLARHQLGSDGYHPFVGGPYVDIIIAQRLAEMEVEGQAQRILHPGWFTVQVRQHVRPDERDRHYFFDGEFLFDLDNHLRVSFGADGKPRVYSGMTCPDYRRYGLNFN